MYWWLDGVAELVREVWESADGVTKERASTLTNKVEKKLGEMKERVRRIRERE